MKGRGFMGTAMAISNIYAEREKFIIIGLTGRTGSGCTTVSEILEKENFKDLCLHEPKTTNFISNEERKYQIIYDYAQNHWNKFISITMTDIIFSFILEKNFSSFNKIYIDLFSKYIEKTKIPKLNDIKKDYDILYTKIKELVGNKHDGSLHSKDFDGEEVLRSLSELKHKIYNILKNLTFDDVSSNSVDKSLSNIETLLKNQLENSEKMKQISSIVKECKYESTTKTISGYTYFLQEIGNRIRHHGSIDEDKPFSGEHMYSLARRANSFIKSIRNKNEQALICLDAIRNPYEATYFQDRYSAFFLVAVSTDDDERVRRLGKHLNQEQIEALDNKEYPRKLKGEDNFTNQDIGACMQLADIYLYNPHEETKEKYFITESIVKYVTLMKHPGLITPTSVERCMQIAYNAKLNSGCLSRQVGAVITDSNFSIKAVGWNSVAEGQVPCNMRNAENYLINKDESSFSTYEIKDGKFNDHMIEKYSERIQCKALNGRLCSYCFKDEYEEITGQKNQVHTRSLHAEENAFLQIVKYGGEGIKGGKLFTSASSCVLCSKKAFQLGIKDIYYIDPYPDIATTHILSFGKDKSKCPQCHLFYGAIGRAYTCLFTQRIAIKDELSCLYTDQKS